MTQGLGLTLQTAHAIQKTDTIKTLLNFFSEYKEQLGCVAIADLFLKARFDSTSKPKKEIQRAARHIRAQLQAYLKEKRSSSDWTVERRSFCSCHLCKTLNRFLKASDEKHKEWPLNKMRRWHIHEVIHELNIPVNHQTKRTGSPYKLMLTKEKQLFAQRKQMDVRAKRLLKQLSYSGLG